MNLESFKAILRPITRRISLMVARGILEVSDDKTKIQLLQLSLLADQTKNGTESMAHFGFTSRPPKGSDVIMVSVGGASENGVIIATEHREYRFKDLGEGEAALYSRDGDHVHMRNGNIVRVKTKHLIIDAEDDVEINTKKMTVNAADEMTINTTEMNINATGVTNITTPTVEISDDVNIGGDLNVTGDAEAENIDGRTSIKSPAMNAAASLIVASQELNGYEAHTHNYQDDDGSQETTKSTSGVN